MSVASEAKAALRRAKLCIEPIEPDGHGRHPRTGEPESWITARLVERVAGDAMLLENLDHELDGTSIRGGVMSCAFVWTHHNDACEQTYKSKPKIIEVQLSSSELGPTAASSWAVTAARKIYLQDLLHIRARESTAGALIRSTDNAFEQVYSASRRLLSDFMRAKKADEHTVLVTTLGLRVEQGLKWTLEQLAPPLQADLLRRLMVWAKPRPTFDPGASPKGCDELPEHLGGGS